MYIRVQQTCGLMSETVVCKLLFLSTCSTPNIRYFEIMNCVCVCVCVCVNCSSFTLCSIFHLMHTLAILCAIISLYSSSLVTADELFSNKFNLIHTHTHTRIVILLGLPELKPLLYLYHTSTSSTLQ